MQYLLFLLAHPISTFFSRSVILQQTFIEIGRERNFVDKVHPCDRFSINSVIIGETLPIENTQKIKRIQPFCCTFRDGRDCNAYGDCVGILDIVKACGAALIRERMLFERSEFFLSLIAFSRIAGLLLYLMSCNRSRKYSIPARSGYVSYSTVSD